VTEVAQRDAAIPFDVVNVELGHKGADCSFDAVIRKYNLTDPALVKLAVIVRGADTDAKDLAPECRGLRRLLTAFGWLTKTIMSYWNVNFGLRRAVCLLPRNCPARESIHSSNVTRLQ
jgi:hypothetical protein